MHDIGETATPHAMLLIENMAEAVEINRQWQD